MKQMSYITESTDVNVKLADDSSIKKLSDWCRNSDSDGGFCFIRNRISNCSKWQFSSEKDAILFALKWCK